MQYLELAYANPTDRSSACSQWTPLIRFNQRVSIVENTFANAARFFIQSIPDRVS